MKKTKAQKENLFLLLKNNLVQFIAGMLASCIFLKLASCIGDRSIEALLRSIGFGLFFYWTTPFVVYWLAYASATKLTKVILGLTVLVIAIYSYVFWDSYFFFKEFINWLLIKPSISY